MPNIAVNVINVTACESLIMHSKKFLANLSRMHLCKFTLALKWALEMIEKLLFGKIMNLPYG